MWALNLSSSQRGRLCAKATTFGIPMREDPDCGLVGISIEKRGITGLKGPITPRLVVGSVESH